MMARDQFPAESAPDCGVSVAPRRTDRQTEHDNFHGIVISNPMTTFYLIRHGMTDHVNRVLSGRASGIHLNEEGSRQAEELPLLFESTRLSAIFSSPLERAQETAAPLAASKQLRVEVSDEI